MRCFRWRLTVTLDTTAWSGHQDHGHEDNEQKLALRWILSDNILGTGV